MKKTIRGALLTGAVVGVLSVGVVTGGAVASSFLSGPADEVPPGVDVTEQYKQNADGLTYGSALDAVSPETEPDLINVVASNGKTGYVLKTELDRASGALDFKSVDEALAWQSSRRSVTSVTVYESDGKTVVGEFIVGNGNARTEKP